MEIKGVIPDLQQQLIQRMKASRKGNRFWAFFFPF